VHGDLDGRIGEQGEVGGGQPGRLSEAMADEGEEAAGLRDALRHCHESHREEQQDDRAHREEGGESDPVAQQEAERSGSAD